MCPVLDYGSSVWHQQHPRTPLPPPPPHQLPTHPPRSSCSGRIRKRAARFVTGNYNYETGSMTGILGQLNGNLSRNSWKNNGHILLYKGLKGKASISTDGLVPKLGQICTLWHFRNQQSMAFQTPFANTDVLQRLLLPPDYQGLECPPRFSGW